MSDNKTAKAPRQRDSQPDQKPAPTRRSYGSGLGHFLISKQRYSRPVEKDLNHSFELGYN